MATDAQIAALKLLIAPTDLTDEQIGSIFDASKNINEAASFVWQSKAAQFSTIVDVAESGSSRKMGDMFDHALKLAQYHGGADSDTGPDAGGRTRIGRIVRE
jgi:Cdc6-like AAA superfamily ATPase